MKEEIIKIVSEVSEVPVEKINENTNLVADLDLESLDLVTLVAKFESMYKIEILDKDIKKIQTVGDIINYIKEHRHICLTCLL